ncbi:CheY chemotaxis protein or a CheY-like REC (receiver) domain [Desulfocicer vacuolatum DSM 3385]|uniref:CheY chemotaxis protein or a CheY-like REC (Receiver) domain n=1 Tax=Desulfocicer vacuolatum DSM 3385 TaxID=1121400 RepID=A0A1W2DFL7_9BACT|nr:response regulator [Desulfocicer vacuolatum]SMC96253.1 CheY chemotaxis protein or a CheY-like REC (receiver) domain [Desulfocicer vacuolatum DSM 3385]
METASVLIVEDEFIIAKDIQASLENMGYLVCAIVSSGEAAIKKLEQENPDLVLMDIILKGKMDGIEAAMQIRSLFNIPIVYLTAYADEDTLERAKITEPYGYVIKPFNDRELRIAIEMATYKHKMETKQEQLVADLQKALAEVKTLHGLLPVCTSCKKIRDDNGYWNQIESYIQEHSTAQISHSLCPECSDKLYGDEDWYIAMKDKDIE